jgi:hypothetical protein
MRDYDIMYDIIIGFRNIILYITIFMNFLTFVKRYWQNIVL